MYEDSGPADRNYGNHGPGAVLNTIHSVGIVVGFLLIINRLYWRWRKGTPGIDDAIIIFAWITLFALGVVTYIAVDYGYARKQETLTRREASDATRMFYLYQIFYKLTLNLSKLSILTLYLRVFDTRDWFGRVTKALVFLVVGFSFSIVMANIFICDPIPLYWNTSPPEDPSRKGGSCINILGYWYASSLYNIISESIMLVSVLVRIWTLPSHSQPPILQFRQKINLTVVLGLGVFTVATAILRVTTLNTAAMADDRTGGTRRSTIWSSIEACLGLAVANLPMLRQLLRWRGWLGSRWFGSTTDKSRSRSHSRRRSEYSPAGQHSGSVNMRSGQNSRRPTAHDIHAPISRSEIIVQRDFHLEVVTTDMGSEDSTDLEAQSNHGAPHIEFSPRSPTLSLSPSQNSLKGGLVNSTEYKAGWGSGTPSIASTLRSPPPVEPLPMVRIGSEPLSSTASLNSVRVSGGGEVAMQPLSAAHVKAEGTALGAGTR